MLGKLVLACEDEILDTTEISLPNKRVICEKNNCLIYDIKLKIMYLSLLVFIFINYYYCIKHWIKKDYKLLYLYKINNAKDFDIKNRTCH